MKGTKLKLVNKNLRLILKQFSPPVVLRMINVLLKKKYTPAITYEGVYESFEQVFSIYGPQPEYSTDAAFKDSVDKAREIITQFNASALSPNWSTQRINILTSYLSGFKSPEIKVLDIGGGFADTYFNLKLSNSKKLDYRVIELERTVTACKEIFKEFPELKFYSSLEDLGFNPDVIYFGSSLQYLKDWREILNFGSQCGASSVIISDTAMGPIETFVAAQVNMPGIVIPRYVFDINEIRSIISKHGYELVHESSNFYTFHNFDNYAPSYREILHKNLIFKRRNT